MSEKRAHSNVDDRRPETETTPEPAQTDHPTGESQAQQNAENEPAG